MKPKLVQPLLGDRVDIIGDIHGEVTALIGLLGRLGCDPEQATVQRPIVFVGDLVDRGPDSVKVVEIVQRLVEAGCAQAVLGNHELNILLDDEKEGNGWFLGHADGWHNGGTLVPFSSRRAGQAERAKILAFLRTLPVALESSTLRVVHAAWVPSAIEAARHASTLDAFMTPQEIDLSGIDLSGAPTNEALRDPTRPVLFHAGLAEQQLREQNSQPIKVLTSGLERPIPAGAAPRYISGKWRLLERDPWWETDTDPRAVVFGHYWRRREGADDLGSKADPFRGIGPTHWFVDDGRAFCVDYSVGLRFRSRHLQADPNKNCALAALRWPERLLFYDDADTPIQT
ncbi:MAG: metallophosphoesterase [Polyangia bacterium]